MAGLNFSDSNNDSDFLTVPQEGRKRDMKKGRKSNASQNVVGVGIGD